MHDERRGDMLAPKSCGCGERWEAGVPSWLSINLILSAGSCVACKGRVLHMSDFGTRMCLLCLHLHWG